MNDNINGYENEYSFIFALNGKKFRELNPLFQKLLEDIYVVVPEDAIIKAWRNHYPQKSDIFIRFDGVMKGISIKKGMCNSVHVEPISEFIHFLIENSVSRENVLAYLRYHYADGSTNGRGDVRLSAEEYKKEHQKEIDDLNEELNNPVLLQKAFERFVLRGNNSNYPIDAIIYGTVEDFIWLTRKDIKEMLNIKEKKYSSAVHFGPLTCQPMNRCLNRNPIYEKNRFCVQLKWHNLHDDIIEMMNYKSMKKIKTPKIMLQDI